MAQTQLHRRAWGPGAWAEADVLQASGPKAQLGPPAPEACGREEVPELHLRAVTESGEGAKGLGILTFHDMLKSW